MSRFASFLSARTTPGVIPSDSRRISWCFSDCGKGPSLKLAAACDSGTGRGSANPLVRIPMKGYSLHFSSWHDLYYVIETQSGRGRVVYAHAWRMCAQYVAERLQSEQSLEDGAGTRPDIQDMLATTQPNALYPYPATDAAQPRPFGKVGRALLMRFLWRFRRRLTRLLPHCRRGRDVRTAHDLRLIES